MTKQIDTKSALITLAKIYVGLDLIWALTVATLVGSLLSGGFNLAACGVPGLGADASGAVGVVSGTLLAFIISSIQGGIFLIVFSIVAFVFSMVFKSLFKIDFKPVWHYGRWVLAGVAVYAFIMATFVKSLVGLGFGIMSGVAGCVSSVSLGFFGSIAAWVLTFVVSFVHGSVFVVVGSIVLFIFAVVGVAIFGGKNGSAG